jgi:hypothetical protein
MMKVSDGFLHYSVEKAKGRIHDVRILLARHLLLKEAVKDVIQQIGKVFWKAIGSHEAIPEELYS